MSFLYAVLASVTLTLAAWPHEPSYQNSADAAVLYGAALLNALNAIREKK